MPGSVITRHFATITTGRWGARQVHYRRVGSGPVVILFHQSPLSSGDMVATMERWKSHFTCIAPDSPGFGLSDPLGVKTASMHDFADAAIEFMDAIGIQRAAVYGFHTGAMISGAIAEAYPHRIVCAAANGYVMMSEGEKRDIVRHYLPEFRPSWDGAHLAWLWSRMREQTIFFPWYAKALANRMYNNVPAPEVLHSALLDFMRSGDHYRVGYRAAFLMKSERTLAKMQTPMLVTAYSSDVLSTHLPRIKRASPRVTIQRGGNIDETHDLCRLYITAHRPPKVRAARPSAALRGRLVQDYVSVGGGQLRLRKNFEGKGRTVVVLHDALGSSDSVADIARGFIGRRPVVVIELPGHGESDSLIKRQNASIADYAGVIAKAIKTLSLGAVDLVGVGAGGLVGVELALRHRACLQGLALIGISDLEGAEARAFLAHGTPSIEPNWFGGHLLEAWHIARDHSLFWPWYARLGNHALRQPTHLEPEIIEQRVLDLLRSDGAWRRTYRAQLSYPWRRRLKRALSEARIRVIVATSELDPLRNATHRVASALPDLTMLSLPPTEQHWGKALLPFLNRR